MAIGDDYWVLPATPTWRVEQLGPSSYRITDVAAGGGAANQYTTNTFGGALTANSVLADVIRRGQKYGLQSPYQHQTVALASGFTCNKTKLNVGSPGSSSGDMGYWAPNHNPAGPYTQVHHMCFYSEDLNNRAIIRGFQIASKFNGGEQPAGKIHEIEFRHLEISANSQNYAFHSSIGPDQVFGRFRFYDVDFTGDNNVNSWNLTVSSGTKIVADGDMCVRAAYASWDVRDCRFRAFTQHAMYVDMIQGGAKFLRNVTLPSITSESAALPIWDGQTATNSGTFAAPGPARTMFQLVCRASDGTNDQGFSFEGSPTGIPFGTIEMRDNVCTGSGISGATAFNILGLFGDLHFTGNKCLNAQGGGFQATNDSGKGLRTTVGLYLNGGDNGTIPTGAIIGQWRIRYENKQGSASWIGEMIEGRSSGAIAGPVYIDNADSIWAEIIPGQPDFDPEETIEIVGATSNTIDIRESIWTFNYDNQVGTTSSWAGLDVEGATNGYTCQVLTDSGGGATSGNMVVRDLTGTYVNNEVLFLVGAESNTVQVNGSVTSTPGASKVDLWPVDGLAQSTWNVYLDDFEFTTSTNWTKARTPIRFDACQTFELGDFSVTVNDPTELNRPAIWISEGQSSPNSPLNCADGAFRVKPEAFPNGWAAYSNSPIKVVKYGTNANGTSNGFTNAVVPVSLLEGVVNSSTFGTPNQFPWWPQPIPQAYHDPGPVFAQARLTGSSSVLANASSTTSGGGRTDVYGQALLTGSGSLTGTLKGSVYAEALIEGGGRLKGFAGFGTAEDAQAAIEGTSSIIANATDGTSAYAQANIAGASAFVIGEGNPIAYADAAAVISCTSEFLALGVEELQFYSGGGVGVSNPAKGVVAG